MKRILYFLLPLLLLVNMQPSIAQTKSADKGGFTDVTDFGVKVNSADDQTEAIQHIIDGANDGDTVFFPEGDFLVRTIKLKSGVSLFSKGILKHHSAAKEGEYSMEKQNSPNPLILGEKVENLTISIRGESINEGIYLLKSHQIKIINSDIKGDSTKLRSYPGIIAFESSGIEIANSRIRNFGMPRTETDSYQPGTGVRILSCNTISIHDSEISNNGENGVFIYGSRKVDVINNVIHHNGMSGIQVAFGDKGKEKEYNFSRNVLDSNAADAIDINNRSLEKAKDIECLIVENISCDNGFVNGKSTPDGSGIGTLINISNVILYKNEAYRNNRPALYVESCGLILAKENWADNQVEVVLDLQELKLEENRFSSVNLIANVKAEKISLIDNELGSLSLPNGIEVNDFLIERNSFSHGAFNFNLKGNLVLKGNEIRNQSEVPAVLVVKANKAVIENNGIESLNSSAIILRSTAESIQILSNKIKSRGPVIFDENSKDLAVLNNTLTSISGGKDNLTFRSHYPRGLVMKENTHVGMEDEGVILFVGQGNATIKNEKYGSGKANYGEVEVSIN